MSPHLTIHVDLQIYDQQTGGYVAAPRDFFRKLSEQDLPGALRTFFCRPDGTFAFRDAIPIVLERLHGIKAAFSSEKVSLIASSVLVAYEALDTDPTSDKAPDRPHVEVRIIDFAHSRFLEGDDVVDDEGYVFGLDNLIGMLDAAYRKEGEEVCD